MKYNQHTIYLLKMNGICNTFENTKYTIKNGLLKIKITCHSYLECFDAQHFYYILEKNKDLKEIEFIFDEYNSKTGCNISTPTIEFLEQIRLQSNIKKITFGPINQYEGSLDITIILPPYIKILVLNKWYYGSPEIDFTENNVLEEIIINDVYDHYSAYYIYGIDLSSVLSLRTIKIGLLHDDKSYVPSPRLSINTIISKFKLPYGCVVDINQKSKTETRKY